MFSRSKTTKGQQPQNTEDDDPVLAQITTLWKSTFEALYKSGIKARRYRFDELQALCLGAGASIVDTPAPELLGPLGQALKYDFGERHSFHTFRVHKSTSSELKESLKQTLDAFAAEIGQVDLLENLLRERQVPLREPEDSDWEGTLEMIRPIMVSTGRRLLHYDARLRVLQMDMEREVRAEEVSGNDGWVVLRDLVYPYQGKSLWSKSTM